MEGCLDLVFLSWQHLHNVLFLPFSHTWSSSSPLVHIPTSTSPILFPLHLLFPPPSSIPPLPPSLPSPPSFPPLPSLLPSPPLSSPPISTGKIMGESSDLAEKEQLVDAVHRDAIRTDPGHPFFANYRRQEESYISQHYHQTTDDNNIQKLINIIVIYTLEHDDISYTQGMTDILSPILYIMKNEADAYICFAAMVERIKEHFNQWCVGTLLKLERLRHLCEVLDPNLYTCLSSGIEEDAFALFFGMVLIECRREFSFDDSFHLLETIWASAACIKNSLPASSPLSNAEWACYMTYQSPEVLHQVFEESGLPYSAMPLPHMMSGSYSIGYPYSRNPSLIMSQSPPSATAAAATFLRRQSEIEGASTIPEHPSFSSSSSSSTSPIPTPLSINHSNSSLDGQHFRSVMAYADGGDVDTSKDSLQSRARSQSDSNLKTTQQGDLGSIRSPCRVSNTSPLKGGVNGVTPLHKLVNGSSHSESELYDSFSNSKILQVKLGKRPTEMSDMSSLSSGTVSARSENLLSSMKSTRNGTPDSATGVSQVRHHSRPAQNSTSTEPGGDSNVPKLSASSIKSDTGSSNSQTSSNFQDALAYLPSMGVSGLSNGIPPTDVPDLSNGIPYIPSTGVPEFPNAISSTGMTDLPDVFLEPENSSLDGGGSPDTLVANKSPRMTAMDVTSTPVKIGGGVAKRKSYTDPKTGANYVTTCAEVHDDLEPGDMYPSNRGPDDRDPALDISRLTQVIERNGMITSVGHKSPLLPHGSSKEASIRSKSLFSPPKQSMSDGEVAHRRKRLSSPKWIHRPHTPAEEPHSNTSTPVHYDTDIPSGHRVTPVAFFDAMEKLAESAPTRGAQFPASFPTSLRGPRRAEGEEGRGNGKEEEKEEEEGVQDDRRQRTDSDAEITLLMSQIVSTEEGAPRVNHKESLTIPFSDCYSLFICLSILVQNRHEIIRTNADFYQLSMILNSQAAKQDLDKTLRIAHQLFRVYRKYQEMCFGPSGHYNNWLDDPEVEHPNRTV